MTQITRTTNHVDYLKAIGIVLVVIGHCTHPIIAKIIYTFHMPLFFLIAGYLFKKQINFKIFFKKTTTRLLIPYFITLSILYPMQEIYYNASRYDHLIDYIKSAVAMIYGGYYVSGWVGVHWFVTTLFGCQIALYFTTKTTIKTQITITSLTICISWMIERFAHNLHLPLSANSMPAALAFCIIGYLGKEFLNRPNKTITSIGAMVIAITIFGTLLNINFSFNIRDNSIGIPILSFAFALLWIYTLFALSKFCENVNILPNPIRFVSDRTMQIMYIHMPVTMILEPYINNITLRMLTVLTITIPIIWLITRFNNLNTKAN